MEKISEFALQLVIMQLTDQECERYKKQLQLADVGEQGQIKLKQASVLVIGAGGLGSPVLMYLTAAGVGKITIMDGDRLSLSNLQRQVVHSTSMVGELKVVSAHETLHRMNPEISIETIPAMLTADNARQVIRGHQVVVDCTDNLPARLLANEVCVQLSKPFVYGAVFEYEGQVSTFDARLGPCFRCMLPETILPELIPNPESYGLLGMVPGVIGMLEAVEVLKILLGLGDALIGKIALFNALTTSITKINLIKRSDCPVCSVKGISSEED